MYCVAVPLRKGEARRAGGCRTDLVIMQGLSNHSGDFVVLQECAAMALSVFLLVLQPPALCFCSPLRYRKQPQAVFFSPFRSETARQRSLDECTA